MLMARVHGVLVQVEIWNNLQTVTLSSSFRAKSSELPEIMVIFALTIEKPINTRKVHRNRDRT